MIDFMKGFFLFSPSEFRAVIAGLKRAKNRAGRDPRPESDPPGVQLCRNLACLSRTNGRARRSRSDSLRCRSYFEDRHYRCRLQDQQWMSFLAISYNNRRTVYLYPITHSLDFDVLFFGMRNNSLHLLLQLCDSRFLFMNLLRLLL